MWDIRGIPPIGPFFSPAELPAGGPIPVAARHIVLVPRVPDADDERRASRATEITASIINSLSRQQILYQKPSGEYDLDVPTVLPTPPNLVPGTYEVTGAVITINNYGIITNILPSPTPIQSVNNVRPIAAYYADVNNVTNTETNLALTTVNPILTADGQTLRFEVDGVWGAGAADTSTLRVYADGGTALITCTASTGPATTVQWSLWGTIQRSGSGTVRAMVKAMYADSFGITNVQSAYTAKSITLGSSFVFKVTGQTASSNSNNITLKHGHLEWVAAT